MLFLQCQNSRDLDQLSYLLGKGLDPNISDSEGEYPLQRVIQRACGEAPRTDDGSVSGTNQALATFFLDAVKLLLAHGAKPQYELYQEQLKKGEQTGAIMLQPLQQAMVGKQVQIVELLLDQDGVQPEAKSSDGSDAWMTAAGLGAGIGDTFLTKLLEHHKKAASDGPLMLAGRSRPKHENFFHVVANHGAVKLLGVPKLIRKCAAKCPSTAELMAEKDSQGYTPVMRLLDPNHQRSVSSVMNESDPDKLQHMRDIDARLVKLLEIYAEQTTKRDAFLRCEEATRLKELSGTSTASGVEGNPSDVAAAPSAPNNNADDSEDDSDDDDSDAGNTTTARSAEPATDGEPDEEAKPKIMVEYETALHFIARRQLTSEPTNPGMKWYGCVDSSINCLMQLLLEKRPELFSFSPEDKEKSLVNFVHLGSFKTALHCAVESGDVPTVELLLTHGADSNLSPARCKNCKEFAIHDAIARASGSAAISRDQYPACTGNCGVAALVEPALFEAVQKRHIKCARLLLKHGARVNCLGKTTQETPLHVALRANDGASVSALLSHGASLMAKDAFGASPLHLAVVARHSIPAKEAHAGEVSYAKVTIAGSFPAGRPIPTNTTMFSVTLDSGVGAAVWPLGHGGGASHSCRLEGSKRSASGGCRRHEE